MMKNVGTADRALRALFGLVLISLTVWGPQTPWGWLGLIPLATAVFAFCPAYCPLKINTTGEKKSCCGGCGCGTGAGGDKTEGK